MGARKQRRYLNSILLMGDRLAAGELSQSEVECEEEEFPDFNDWKGFFSSASPEFVNGEKGAALESYRTNSKGQDKKEKSSEGDIIAMLKKRLSKSTRRLIVRSCTDSKFFQEFEEHVVAFKLGNEKTEKPTTFEEPDRREEEDQGHCNPHLKVGEKRRKLMFKEFDSFQRFLAHRIAKFHDVQSESIAIMGCKGMKNLELSLPMSTEGEQHHKYRILEVLAN